jgi:hypothetical protein
MRKMLGFACVAVIVPTSCVSATKSTTPAAPAAVNVTAVNDAFTAPASVAAGAVSVTLENNGKEAHQAQLFKLLRCPRLHRTRRRMSSGSRCPRNGRAAWR